jgi:hypothetical protein
VLAFVTIYFNNIVFNNDNTISDLKSRNRELVNLCKQIGEELTLSTELVVELKDKNRELRENLNRISAENAEIRTLIESSLFTAGELSGINTEIGSTIEDSLSIIGTIRNIVRSE